MTLTTDLPGEQTLVLKAKAKAQGVSTGSQHQRQSSRRCHSPLVPRPPSSAQCKATVGMASLAAGNLPPASGVRLILDVAKR
jgi:hypothetical protein